MQIKDPVRTRYYFKHIDFTGYWRIVWFGRITRLSEGADTVSIYVYLGRLSVSDNLAYSLPLEYKRILMPIGDLTVLYIGAVLKEGHLQYPEELPPHFNKTKEITLDLTKKNIKAVPRTEKDEVGNIVPFTYQWPFYQEPQADAYVLGVNHNNSQFGVIIPCAEILRFFYCYATNIAKVVTSHRILRPGRYLYNKKKSSFDAQNSIVTLKPRTAVTDETAIFLALFVSGYFKIDRAQEIPKMIAAISQTEPERPFVAFPPLDGQLTLQVAYATHSNHFGNQIIITRILSADIVPNFQAIKIGDRVIGKDPKQDGASSERHRKHIKQHPKSLVKLNPGAVNPALGEENQFENELAERFPAFGQIVRLPAWDRKNGDVKFSHSSIEHSEGSTNDKKAKEGQNHHTRISPSSIPEPDDETTAFERIIATLLLIRAANLAGVEFLELTEQIQRPENTDNDLVYNLPRHGHEESWAYINRHENIRRKIIIARITKDNTTRYLVEFEQKTSGECSTLLLWDPVSDVLGSEIVAAIEECIENNATYLQKKTFGHAWSRLRHSWKKNEHLKSEHFLHRIFEAEPALRGI